MRDSREVGRREGEKMGVSGEKFECVSIRGGTDDCNLD